MQRPSHFCLLFFSLLFSTFAAQAQQSIVETITVPAKTTLRSQIIHVKAGDELQARLSGENSSGTIRTFAYRKDKTLVGTEDPENEQAYFSFDANADGEYYLLFQNPSDFDSKVTVSVAGARGAPTSFPPSAIVRVFYVSDRQLVSDSPIPLFKSEYTNEVSYGACYVAVPRAHELGELEGPAIFRLQRSQNPTEQITLVSGKPRSESQMLRTIEERNLVSTNHEVLIFIHGFNVDFREGILRAAQLSYDLGFDGPIILFSWPSQGSLSPTGYERDQRNSDLSIAIFKDFLLRLQKQIPNCTVHIIAHSMGNKILVNALKQISTENPGSRKVGEVIMFAPDVDTEMFSQLSEKGSLQASRMTLYASSRDLALKASEAVARYPRAGEGGPQLLIKPWLQSVDASSVDTSALGAFHSYYADNGTILSDLFYLLQGQSPDQRFGLSPERSNGLKFWTFKPRSR